MKELNPRARSLDDCKELICLTYLLELGYCKEARKCLENSRFRRALIAQLQVVPVPQSAKVIGLIGEKIDAGTKMEIIGEIAESRR